VIGEELDLQRAEVGGFLREGEVGRRGGLGGLADCAERGDGENAEGG
jgi:hypothetical protein